MLAAVTVAQTANQSTAPSHIRNGSLPAVSPDGRHVAFLSDRTGNQELFVIGSDGTGERQLTNSKEDKTFVGWFSDSRRIAFSVFANNVSTIYMLDVAGNDCHEVGNVSGRGPTLSPDGHHVVFIEGSWTSMRLILSKLDGSEASAITDGSAVAWNSHWSPSGKQIAFTSRDPSQKDLAVFIMNADGSERHLVSHIPAEEGAAQSPAWSPDGRYLAIQVNSRLTKNVAHIWILKVSSAEARKLNAHSAPYLDENPTWFPDGKHIAFQSDRTGQMEVWVMKTDGTLSRQLTK